LNDEHNDNNNNQKRTEQNKNNYTGNAFLSTTIIQPIFHNSNSNLPLSRFLTLPFDFSVMRTISLIDQSVKGYFQFGQTEIRDEQVLEFLPLEKVDEEYYLPEEIEEEIIFPSNLSVPLTRKVTSSSFSPAFTQRSEKMPAFVSNADLLGNAQSKVNLRNQQQSPRDSMQRTSDNKIVRRKRSVVENPSKEEKLPSLRSTNNRSPKFTTEPEKYPSEKLAGAFSSKTKTLLPKNADQSIIRKSSLLSSSSKVHSSRIVSSEGSQLFPRKYSETAKLSSSSSPLINASSKDTSSTMRLSESKAGAVVSDSSKSAKSKVIAKDDAKDDSSNDNPQYEQYTNITKKMLEPSTKTFSGIQPDAKIQMEDTVQTTKIATPADKSLNPSDITSQSAQDDSIRLSMSRTNTMSTSFASITPSKTKIDDENRNNNNSNNNNNIIKPHELPAQRSVSDRNHKPTITINKLDVHVIGSNNNNVQRAILSHSTESPDIHSHKLDFEDHQINTEILNKSYLWKYKVRLS
jgi:hypothetical protein